MLLGLHGAQGGGQFVLEGVNELAAGGHWRIGGAFPTDENDAGSKSIRLPISQRTRAPSSVRTGHVPLIVRPALIAASRNVSHPVLVSPSSLLL